MGRTGGTGGAPVAPTLGFMPYFGGLYSHWRHRHPGGFCHFGVAFRLAEWLGRPPLPRRAGTVLPGCGGDGTGGARGAGEF